MRYQLLHGWLAPLGPLWLALGYGLVTNTPWDEVCK